MIKSTIVNDRPRREAAAMETFLESPNEESFTELFLTMTPQLVSFFRSRDCARDLSDDLSQEVMLTVYQKSSQLRDRTRFRAWLFTIGRHALHRHYKRQSPEADSFDFDTRIDPNPPGSPAFEFHRWMTVLKPHESEALILRFVEQREYHEIAAAQSIPVGTAQWRVFNAKKKLATRLRAGELCKREAA